MSNLGGTTFKFVYANHNRLKRNSNYDIKEDEPPPDYNTISDVVAYNADNE